MNVDMDVHPNSRLLALPHLRLSSLKRISERPSNVLRNTHYARVIRDVGRSSKERPEGTQLGGACAEEGVCGVCGVVVWCGEGGGYALLELEEGTDGAVRAVGALDRYGCEGAVVFCW